MIDKTVFFLVYFKQHICVILYIYTIWIFPTLIIWKLELNNK